MIFKTLLVLLAVIFTYEAKSQIKIKGVIGEDNRRILPLPPESPYHAIGRVNIAGYKNRSLCTGTLIKADKVITAAHCLFNPRTKRPHPIKNIHFLAGKNGSNFTAHSKAKKVVFTPDYKGLPPAKMLDFAKDIAIITLEKQLPIKPLPILKISAPDYLNHIMYVRDRPHRPSIHENCKSLHQTAVLWITDCDTNFGGSGGPVFIQHENTPTLVAVMVGIVPQKASIAIPVVKWQSLLEEK